MKIEDIFPVRDEEVKERETLDSKTEEEKRSEIDRLAERALLENQKNFIELSKDESFDAETRELYKKAYEISKRISDTGEGLALVVGGFARDSILKSVGFDVDPKDIDIEVYGVDIDKLNEILSEFGTVNAVGAQFGVLKLDDLDISIPRRDSKTGEGHKGFEITGDPNMLVRDASKRRDLTINSLALNPMTGEVIDPVGGIDDILDKKLRAVDLETFKEDPLRVLRVMQFAGRFDFDVEENTKQVCIELVRNGELKKLSVERFEEEWKKLLLKSKKPSKGLEVARELEVITEYPELRDLIDCPQENDWHPEGDVWTHTLMVLDVAKEISDRESLNPKQSLVLLLSALCHDLGKPATTKVIEVKGVERITSRGHEEAGVDPTRSFLNSIHISDEIINEVVPLVVDHLVPTKYTEDITNAAIKRLAKRLSPASIKTLVQLGEADVHGRGYWKDQPNSIPDAKDWDGYPSGNLLLENAKKIPDISPEGSKFIRYIGGKKLLELGLKPGKQLGEIISELDKAQEEDKIDGPEDIKLAKLMVFLYSIDSSKNFIEDLLTGDQMTKEDMKEEIKDRLFGIGTHDMGTLVMTLILQDKPLPPILERNKKAILTAHKYGPAWFKHFDKEFYETAWQSFYGSFEVDIEEQKKLSKLDYSEQLEIGIDLIVSPKNSEIEKYKETINIAPVQKQGKLAMYITDQYPFETGMMEGFEVMVQFLPDTKRLCVSVMNEDPERVAEIDKKIREVLPQFAKAKKVGYLFSSNEDEEDNIYSSEDAQKVFDTVCSIFN